jgi:hypothetical protein
MQHAPPLALALIIPIAPMELKICAAWQDAHGLELGRGSLIPMFTIRAVSPDHIWPNAPSAHGHKRNVQRCDFFLATASDIAPTSSK